MSFYQASDEIFASPRVLYETSLAQEFLWWGQLDAVLTNKLNVDFFFYKQDDYKYVSFPNPDDKPRFTFLF